MTEQQSIQVPGPGAPGAPGTIYDDTDPEKEPQKSLQQPEAEEREAEREPAQRGTRRERSSRAR